MSVQKSDHGEGEEQGEWRARGRHFYWALALWLHCFWHETMPSWRRRWQCCGSGSRPRSSEEEQVLREAEEFARQAVYHQLTKEERAEVVLDFT
jgi:hypothetical protein